MLFCLSLSSAGQAEDEPEFRCGAKFVTFQGREVTLDGKEGIATVKTVPKANILEVFVLREFDFLKDHGAVVIRRPGRKPKVVSLLHPNQRLRIIECLD